MKYYHFYTSNQSKNKEVLIKNFFFFTVIFINHSLYLIFINNYS